VVDADLAETNDEPELLPDVARELLPDLARELEPEFVFDLGVKYCDDTDDEREEFVACAGDG
jgi:hypothetical protein